MTRSIDKTGWLFIAVVAISLIYQLACEPIVGLNDNADFWRIMESYGLRYPQEHKPDLVSFSRHYEWDGGLVRPKMFPSTELLPTGLAVAVSGVLSKNGMFDIVVLGLLQACLYVVGLSFLVSATTQWRTLPRVALCLLVLLVFCDVGYVSYFNSLYTESASLIFLVASLGVLAHIVLRRCSDRELGRLVPAFFVATGLFAFAKVQNVPVALILAVFGYHLSRRVEVNDKSARSVLRKRGRLLAFVLALLCVAFWWGFKYVPGMHVNNIYNMVFNEITHHSDNPVRDLRELGLDETYRSYLGTYAWAPQVTEDLRRDVFRKVGDKGVIVFFLRHPARLWDLAARCARSTFVMRVPYLGNFESSAVAHVMYDAAKLGHDVLEYDNRGSGYPYRLPDVFRSQACDLWSSFKDDHVPKTWWFLVLCFVFSLGAIGAKRKWFDTTWQHRLATDAHLCILVCAGLQFWVAVIGEAERDIVKHLFLFNLLCDICFVFLAVYAWSLFSSLTRRSTRLSRGH